MVRACTSAVTTVLPDRLQLMVAERRMARLHSENCVSTASQYRCACKHGAETDKHLTASPQWSRKTALLVSIDLNIHYCEHHK